ncbi:hypothetical protein ACS0TY_034927 [Phlomoides rotata]
MVQGFDDLIVSGLVILGMYPWDLDVIRKVCVPDDVNRIIRTALPPIGRQDKLMWHYERNDNYSVKSAYKLCMPIINGTSGAGLEDSLEDWVLHFLTALPLEDKEMFDTSEMGMGITIHDDREGEAISLHEALSWIKDLEFERVIIEMDVKVVVDAVNNLEIYTSVFGDIVDGCRREFRVFLQCRVERPSFVDDIPDMFCSC